MRYPLGLKLAFIIAILLVGSLSCMIFLASYFFLQDATVRVEENNHTLARIVAAKVEEDVRGLMDARGLLDAAGGRRRRRVRVALLRRQREPAVRRDTRAGRDPQRQGPRRGGHRRGRLRTRGRVRGKSVERAKGGAAVVFNATAILGHSAIGLAVPYRDREFEGTLVAIELADRYAEILVPSNKWTTLFVTNDQGELVLHPDLSLLAGKVDYREDPLVAEIMKSAAGNGLMRYAGRGGEETLGAFRRTSFASLGVAVTVPVAKAFEAVEAIQRRNLLIMGAVLSAAVVVAYFFSKSITNPVKALMGAALRIEAGDFHLGIRARTHDELGALTESFVEMGRGLAEREKIKDAFGKFVNKSIAETGAAATRYASAASGARRPSSSPTSGRSRPSPSGSQPEAGRRVPQPVPDAHGRLRRLHRRRRGQVHRRRDHGGVGSSTSPRGTTRRRPSRRPCGCARR
ncbi:MAG: HAMP domain-containing protein [Rhodopseudomonas palustris]|nr:HAMP domain-containing protein [Rhodopseudomonas palustris]